MKISHPQMFFPFIFLWWITGCSYQLQSSALEPFSTNGCSLFPDHKVLPCCTDHDIDYWQGGNSVERKTVDMRFKNCVREKTGSEALSVLAYSGVRVGGSPYWPPGGGWGYGWAFGRGYTALSNSDKTRIKIEITRRLREYEASCEAGDQKSCEVEVILAKRLDSDNSNGATR